MESNSRKIGQQSHRSLKRTRGQFVKRRRKRLSEMEMQSRRVRIPTRTNMAKLRKPQPQPNQKKNRNPRKSLTPTPTSYNLRNLRQFKRDVSKPSRPTTTYLFVMVKKSTLKKFLRKL